MTPAQRLKALIGQRVEIAVEFAEHLIIVFANEKVLCLRGVEPRDDSETTAFEYRIGRSMVDWRDLDLPQNPRTENLIGRTFEGVDSDVLVFSGGFGVIMERDRVHWVKAIQDPATNITVS